MKKYDVIVTRDTTESAIIRVEAESKDQAADIALEKAREAPVGFEWRTNDIYDSDPYLGDCPENDAREAEDEPETPNIECDNCSGKYRIDQIVALEEVEHLAERLDPGGIVPAGECPNCGAFCYYTDRNPDD